MMLTPITLCINSGSSSIKFQLLQDLQLILTGSCVNIQSNNSESETTCKFSYSPHNDEAASPLSTHKSISISSSTKYEDVFEQILKAIMKDDIVGRGQEGKDRIHVVAHRIVHGGAQAAPLIIKHGDKDEKLEKMDSISDFAPLHNHHAMLIVKTCLHTLPKATSVLCFDTLFHTTIPDYRTKYPISEVEHPTSVPLRRFGFHGLSYASILDQMGKHLKKPRIEMNLVVAHLGSGGSICLIQGGNSMNTTMGLTPLEGLPGGTRSGSIDPSLIFHHTPDCSEKVDWAGREITKAELVLNKESGFQALAGTSDFGVIVKRAFDPSSCTLEESTASKLAYSLYIAQINSTVASYISTLFASPSPFNRLDGLIFTGGIGESATRLRKDVLESLEWIERLGKSQGGIDNLKNESGEVGKLRKITKEGSMIPAYVVETNEELECAKLAMNAVSKDL